MSISQSNYTASFRVTDLNPGRSRAAARKVLTDALGTIEDELRKAGFHVSPMHLNAVIAEVVEG